MSNNYIFEQWDEEKLNLSMELLRGIYSYGFDTPSPIQQKSIIPLMTTNDVIAQAQSGTGKTGAFVIGSLTKVDKNNTNPQVLILSPTRELSIQNYNVTKSISQFMKNVNVHLLIGGTSVNEDKQKLMNEPSQVVVGTPGRVYDLIQRGVLNTEDIKTLVLDEADEMLSKGFKEQVYNIFRYMDKDIQVALFSATFPNECKELSMRFMRDPIKILVNREQLTLEGIKQYYVNMESDTQKYMTLKDLFDRITLSQCIIYCNSISRVQTLTQQMRNDNFPVVSIYGSMTQKERLQSLEEFKQGAYRVLISSDIIARGIDIQQVRIIINYDIPNDVSTYLHRIGRGGRWGRKGIAINFVENKQIKQLEYIQDYYQTQIDELTENFNNYLLSS